MFDIRSLTWDEWSYPEGVILPIVTLGTIRPEDSGAARNATSFIIKLYSETQVSGRLGMSGGISPRHAQNPLSGVRRKTPSITHHALSPPPSHHHLYIIHLINWLQRFYRIIMSLKRPFVPKSDVKQWITTTYISHIHIITIIMIIGLLFWHVKPTAEIQPFGFAEKYSSLFPNNILSMFHNPSRPWTNNHSMKG